LRIAGQTAGLIGLIFFVDTHGRPRGVKGYKKFEFLFQNSYLFKFFSSNYFPIFFQNYFFSRATPGPSSSKVYRSMATSSKLLFVLVLFLQIFSLGVKIWHCVIKVITLSSNAYCTNVFKISKHFPLLRYAILTMREKLLVFFL